jgi:hypothetical protein
MATKSKGYARDIALWEAIYPGKKYTFDGKYSVNATAYTV